MRRWMLTSFAAGMCALGVGTSVRADNDVMRLGGKGDDAETLEARWGHGGGFHGGRGYHGGGFYGGGRSYYGGGFYNRGYYGGGYYRPYYYGNYYRPYYGSYYRYPVYYSNPVYYSSPVYYSPCASAPAATVTLGAVSAPVTNDVTVLRPVQNLVPQAQVPQNVQQPSTFPYDGGAPRVPIPSDAAPMSNPNRSTIPYEGKLVSLPASNNSYTFRAYGENMLTPARDTLLVSNTQAADTFRLSMPQQTTGGTTSLR
ncbi:MAG: hypothetical protein U0744_20155 [Gemmataceae bacterium]